mmetsp:Transcript_55726/g.107528  ORF Transcript_55726/g.107528 Transcript_55726/m.107528 type:complete len:193 (-) Transcript_55726:132-710(-)
MAALRAAARSFRSASVGSIAVAVLLVLGLALSASQVLWSAVVFVLPLGTKNCEQASAASLRGKAVVIDPVSRSEEQHVNGVGPSKGAMRRSGLALLAILGGALSVGSRADAKKKSLLDDDGADFSSSKLDGMLKKDFGKAQEETKCKLAEEGELRSYCRVKEINEANRKAAEAKGEKYVDQKGKLSKGSYGV